MTQSTLNELTAQALTEVNGGLISPLGFPYNPRPMPAPIAPLDATDDEVLVAMGQPA